jgi:hypothetical protein
MQIGVDALLPPACRQHAVIINEPAIYALTERWQEHCRTLTGQNVVKSRREVAGDSTEEMSA